MRNVIDDGALIQAVRKRLLRELGSQHAASQVHNTINNNQSGGHGGGGLMEAMNGGQPGGSDDPFEYLVDIEKHDIPGEDGGKPVGWTKKVHRHREKKGGLGK